MKSRNKDKKTHESIIGKIIYGFLLFMPLLAIAVTCAYVIFNKNAYQSYSAEQSQNYSLVDTNSISEDTLYYFKTDNNLNNQVTGSFIPANSISVISGSLNIPNNPTRFRIYYNPNNSSYSLQIDGDTTLYSVIGNTSNINVFTFSFIADGDLESNPYSNNLLLYEFSEQQTLDNVFYYSIDKVEESPLFNWAENSAIYTGMSATCNTLNITTPFIPLLMTYWLIISVIYILYDIILVILHIFHKKIHQLEDSF